MECNQHNATKVVRRTKKGISFIFTTPAIDILIPAKDPRSSEVPLPGWIHFLQRAYSLRLLEKFPAPDSTTTPWQSISMPYGYPKNILKTQKGILLAWNAARHQAIYPRVRCMSKEQFWKSPPSKPPAGTSHSQPELDKDKLNSWGKNVVMVVGDRLSKYTNFTPLAHLYTAHSSFWIKYSSYMGYPIP